MVDSNKELMRSCVDCGSVNCDSRQKEYPEFCLTEELKEDTVKKIRCLYEDDENNRISRVSAAIENQFYMSYTRVEETVEFARRMGFEKIGIATCVGLLKESRVLANILREKGFEVYSAACKVGSFKKEEVGVPPEDITRTGPFMCNPIMQAELLNSQQTELNIIMGLCVGHDCLFTKYSQALVTTLVAKDRVLAHNTVGALYQVDSYYKKLRK